MDVLTRSRTQSLILGGVALGALFLVGFAIMASSASADGAPLGNRLAFGVALEATVAATAVGWWIACRRAQLPTWVMVAACGWGVIVARLWVPHAQLSLLIALGGLTEAIAVGWAVLRLHRIVRTARAARGSGPIGR